MIPPNGPAAAAAIVVAAALAAERCVALAKAAVPALDAAPGDDRPSARPAAERGRALAVHAIAFAAAWGAVALLADEVGGTPLDPARAPLLALAATGVAAFWARLLALSAALRDAAAARGAAERLRHRAESQRLGLPLHETAPPRGPAADRRSRLRLLLDAQAPERLDAAPEHAA